VSVRCLAGGALLEELRRALLQLLEKDITGKDNIHDKKDKKELNYKKTALDIIISGEWRSRLKHSVNLANKLLDNMVEGLETAGYDIVDLRFYLASPGLVGVGSGVFNAIFEVGLEMDWLLGLPVIRGSSLKGAARAIIEESASRKPGLMESLDVFFGTSGSEGRRGAVIILDSYPIGCKPGYPCLILTGDVVTPHYYDGGKAVDSEAKAEPNPVQHVAIAPGVVAGVPGSDIEPGLDKHAERILSVFGIQPVPGVPPRLYALAVTLQAALANGVGARSGKGYNVLLPYVGESLETRVVSIRVRESQHEDRRRAGSGSRRGPDRYRGRGGRGGRRRR